VAQVDSLLRVIAALGADELRLGSDRTPQALLGGAPKKLSAPATPAAELKLLLAEIVPASAFAELESSGRIEATHEAQGLGAFSVRITARRHEGPGLYDVSLRRGARSASSAAPAPAPAAPAPPPAAPMVRAEARTAPSPQAPPAQRPEPSPAQPAGKSALERLVALAVERAASDLHLAEGKQPVARVDGRLVPLDVEGATGEEALRELFPSVDGASPTASHDDARPLAGRRVRVHTYRTAGAKCAALRILPQEPPELSRLELPAAVAEIAALTSGLVIVCGPTGSGKSTTLAALALARLARRPGLLVGLEDPVEYVLPEPRGSLVRQRHVGRDVPDFATGLRDALREDPDVILVGEMRDAESIELAVTAAETGHLVLASLHARNAAGAIDRILDGARREHRDQIRASLAQSLRAVIAQQLLPRRGGGRVAVAEVLRGTSTVAHAIREGRSATMTSAMQAGAREGMVPLDRTLADLVRRGSLDPEIARDHATDPRTFESYLAG
jgi:twitching motility protein PilT